MEKSGISSVLSVVNASDLFQKEYFMSLKEENIVRVIFMFCLHHVVVNAENL